MFVRKKGIMETKGLRIKFIYLATIFHVNFSIFVTLLEATMTDISKKIVTADAVTPQKNPGQIKSPADARHSREKQI
jgi:hypothetical protein